MFGERGRNIYRGVGPPCHSKKVPVIIHSSSHLGSHRGVVAKVQQRLENEFDVRIEAQGGRKWDDNLIHRYKKINREGDGEPKLHIIILGDNDLRGTPLGNPVNPRIKEFGEAVRKFEPRGVHTVFVNGLLPFPIFNRPDSCTLIENFTRYAREMIGLIQYSPDIYYIPMRESIKEYCEDRRVDASRLFKADKVHLNGEGEEFLIHHIVRQARMYKAATGLCVRPEDLVFFQNVANLHRTEKENTKVILREYDLTSVVT